MVDFRLEKKRSVSIQASGEAGAISGRPDASDRRANQRDLALRRAMLSERRTGATLGHMQLRSHLLNAGTATRGA
jgi:hypothetical protein